MTSMRSGYRTSPYDGRDWLWSPRSDSEAGEVRLEPIEVRDQGGVPCCGSMATTAAMMLVDALEGDVASLSPLFHYYNARLSPSHLGDLTLRGALASAARDGVCRAELHDPSMDRAGALEAPAATAYDDASERRVVAYDATFGRVRYYALDGSDRVERWRNALSEGLPVLLGFHTTQSYWDGEGIAGPLAEPSLGGHAAVAVGFDDRRETFTVHDSRGSSFGDEGHWPLAYAAVDSRLVDESWTIERLTYDE